MNIHKNDQLIYLLLFLSAFLTSLAFAYYTQHAWEDWYITYRASKNLAIGNGLVFTIGERIHSFTSPLGTLIPAALNFLTGNSSDDLVLWLYRLLNFILRGFTAILLFKIANTLRLNVWATTFLIVMFFIDLKTVDFAINGMETGIVIFFLALTIYALITPINFRSLLLGVSWGGLMWSRPDSFIYIGAIAIGFLIFNPKISIKESRTDLAKLYSASAAITSLIYLPWLIWAWSYYGSFIPHTIVAKGLTTDPLARFLFIFQDPAQSIKYFAKTFQGVFLPAYYSMGGWPDSSELIGATFAFAAAIVCFVPKVRPITRTLSCVVLIAHIYLNVGMAFVYAWYFPMVAFLSAFVIALIIDQCLEIFDRHQSKSVNGEKNIWFNADALTKSLVVLMLISVMSLTLSATYQIRIQQAVVENNRKNIGLWLRENASSPQDRVFLEPLGYIGFYSNLKMLDHPGLSSAEVVAATRKLGNNHYDKLIAYLQPEWLVLRPRAIKRIQKRNPKLLEETYSVAMDFDVSEKIASYHNLPGRGYLEWDQQFLLFRRR